MGCIFSVYIRPDKKIFPQTQIDQLKSKFSFDKGCFKSKKSPSVTAKGDNKENEPLDYSRNKNDSNAKENDSGKSEDLIQNDILDSNNNVERTDKDVNCYFLELTEADTSDGNNTNIEYIVRKEPITMFKKLEPLINPPKLTVDILEKKLRKTEEKRHQLMRKRRHSAKNKNFDPESKMENIKEKISAADKNREALLQKIRDKQSLQQERVKRAKDRVDRMREIDQELLDELEIMNEAENEENGYSWTTKESANSNGRLTVSNHGLSENIQSGQSEKNIPLTHCQEIDKDSLELERIIGPGISSGSSSNASKKELSQSPTIIGNNIYQFPPSKQCSSSGEIMDSFYDN